MTKHRLDDKFKKRQGQRTILLVIAHKATLDLYGNLLSKNGFLIKKSENALKALMKFDRTVDMALIDYEMPDMDGMELAGFLKGKWDAPIVLLTGIEFPEVKHVDVVIHKPIPSGDLVPIIKGLFDSFELESK